MSKYAIEDVLDAISLIENRGSTLHTKSLWGIDMKDEIKELLSDGRLKLDRDGSLKLANKNGG